MCGGVCQRRRCRCGVGQGVISGPQIGHIHQRVLGLGAGLWEIEAVMPATAFLALQGGHGDKLRRQNHIGKGCEALG